MLRKDTPFQKGLFELRQIIHLYCFTPIKEVGSGPMRKWEMFLFQKLSPEAELGFLGSGSSEASKPMLTVAAAALTVEIFVEKKIKQARKFLSPVSFSTRVKASIRISQQRRSIIRIKATTELIQIKLSGVV